MELFRSFHVVATAIGVMLRGVDVRVALGAAGLLLALAVSGMVVLLVARATRMSTSSRSSSRRVASSWA